MNKLNLKCAPSIIYSDFKQAIHSAGFDIFPEVIRKGCRFPRTIYRKKNLICLQFLKRSLKLEHFLNYFLVFHF